MEFTVGKTTNSNMKTFAVAVALACLVAIASADGPMCDKLKEMINDDCTGPKEGAMDAMEQAIQKKCEEKDSSEKCAEVVAKFKQNSAECLDEAQKATKDIEMPTRCTEFVNKIKSCMKNKGP